MFIDKHLKCLYIKSIYIDINICGIYISTKTIYEQMSLQNMFNVLIVFLLSIFLIWYIYIYTHSVLKLKRTKLSCKTIYYATPEKNPGDIFMPGIYHLQQILRK